MTFKERYLAGEIPFEELPDSFTCPVCRQPKTAFVKK